MDPRIPVTVLTGFLGSGKTTLLNRLLVQPAMADTAVVINEVGEAGLDHILAGPLTATVESSRIADNMVLLESGCLCCTLSNELADTLRDLFFKRALGGISQFQRLVIETTGLADPGPILAKLLTEPVIGSVYRLDAVVVTVDAVHGGKQFEQHIEARKQAAVADVLLLTKTDLASTAEVERLSAKLADINPGAERHQVINGNIEASTIVDVGLFDAESLQAKPQRWLRTPQRRAGLLAGAQYVHDIQNFTVTLPSPLAWEALEPILVKLCETHGEQLLRLKGIIHADDLPVPIAVHAVQHTLYPPVPLEDWEEDKPVSRLVLIGRGLDEAEIRKQLMRF